MSLNKLWALVLSFTASNVVATTDSCAALTSLSLENTTIVTAYLQKTGANASTPLSCSATGAENLIASADVCRIHGYINTTAISSLVFEAWLPDIWYGRFIGLGNGGLGGCVDFSDLDYTSYLHFAAIATNNGHDGMGGSAFLNNTEVINDFAYRSIHTEAIIGKQIVEAYYQNKPAKSYYLGCSTGGRQAVQTAMLYPEDFDGMVGGSPAANWNNLVGAGGMFGKYVDAPAANTENGFIPAEMWPIITREIMKQCDGLDGLVDGIISEPDDCILNLEHLVCGQGDTENCLNRAQFNALQNIYSPLRGSHEQELFSRYDPGAESNGQWQVLLGGNVLSISGDWFQYAVFNNSDSFSMSNFSVGDVEFGDYVNRGGIATWDGDLSEFRDRGGKFLTFHGRSDPMIPSGNSKRLYKRIASKLSSNNLDDFYRFFSIPGMQHCGQGPGSTSFGQGLAFGDQTNTPNDTSHNILLALVDWVEGGVAPDVIIGTSANGTERNHCRYPRKSHWDGAKWICT